MVGRTFVDSLDSRTFYSYLAAPLASFPELVQTMLVDFGVVSPEAAAAGRLRDQSPYNLLGALHDSLLSIGAVGATAVLVVDEAHDASSDWLEGIRLLSNLEGGDAKLLTIVLIGRPELIDRLGGEEALDLEPHVFRRVDGFAHIIS
jgi:general secretion pathway protein A